MKTNFLRSLTCVLTAFSIAPSFAEPKRSFDRVRVAAVQISGYDKTDTPRSGYDPADAMIPYIERAAKDRAELVVFPEYILGRIKVPNQSTKKISTAAAKHKIYVIVGCWEP